MKNISDFTTQDVHKCNSENHYCLLLFPKCKMYFFHSRVITTVTTLSVPCYILQSGVAEKYRFRTFNGDADLQSS